jgi:hypothetical protein
MTRQRGLGQLPLLQAQFQQHLVASILLMPIMSTYETQLVA